jgi:hypothetical protein
MLQLSKFNRFFLLQPSMAGFFENNGTVVTNPKEFYNCILAVAPHEIA